MTASGFSPDLALQQLKDVRLRLLQLHKALLDAEKETYEAAFGRVRTNMEYFHLVLEHEWFQWLRPMSGLIAEVDEAIGNKKEPITTAAAIVYLERTLVLLEMNPNGAGHTQKYYEAIERNADVARLHVELTEILRG
jgi:hypothetical protein